MKYICNKCRSYHRAQCIIDIDDTLTPNRCLFGNINVSWEPYIEYEQENIKNAYVVMNNHECGVGRPPDFPTVVTTSPTVAKKHAKGKFHGSNCPIKEFKIFKINNYWYGPVNVLAPSIGEQRRDLNIDKQQEAIERAKELGMTNEEINVLMMGF